MSDDRKGFSPRGGLSVLQLATVTDCCDTYQD